MKKFEINYFEELSAGEMQYLEGGFFTSTIVAAVSVGFAVGLCYCLLDWLILGSIIFKSNVVIGILIGNTIGVVLWVLAGIILNNK